MDCCDLLGIYIWQKPSALWYSGLRQTAILPLIVEIVIIAESLVLIRILKPHNKIKMIIANALLNIISYYFILWRIKSETPEEALPSVIKWYDIVNPYMIIMKAILCVFVGYFLYRKNTDSKKVLITVSLLSVITTLIVFVAERLLFGIVYNG